jgi:hypothetical protein
MWGRIGLSLALAVLLALPTTRGFAVDNPDPVGRATLGAGSAFMTRGLTSGQTRVALRLPGLSPNAQVIYRIKTGGSCSSGVSVIQALTPMQASRQGLLMSSQTFPTIVPVNAPGLPIIGIVICVYDVSVAGKELLITSGSFIGVPDTGSAHSW